MSLEELKGGALPLGGLDVFLDRVLILRAYMNWTNSNNTLYQWLV